MCHSYKLRIVHFPIPLGRHAGESRLNEKQNDYRDQVHLIVFHTFYFRKIFPPQLRLYHDVKKLLCPTELLVLFGSTRLMKFSS